MKYGQELPKEVEARLDAYIERIKAIQWFKPAKDFKRETAESQVQLALEAFGVKASLEWRSLKTEDDWVAAWDAARDAAWDAARDAAWVAAWDAARDAARDAAWDAARVAARGAARDAARGAAWDAAWDAAWGANEILVADLKEYKGKQAFLQLIPLWEMGLYPIGVVGGKFVIYQPETE